MDGKHLGGHVLETNCVCSASNISFAINCSDISSTIFLYCAIGSMYIYTYVSTQAVMIFASLKEGRWFGLAIKNKVFLENG